MSVGIYISSLVLIKKPNSTDKNPNKLSRNLCLISLGGFFTLIPLCFWMMNEKLKMNKNEKENENIEIVNVSRKTVNPVVTI